MRDAIFGAVIGAVVCAGIWTGLVLLAVQGKGQALGPVLLVGAGVGVVAGLFLGGCGGALAGARKLEHHEHETRPPLPERGS